MLQRVRIRRDASASRGGRPEVAGAQAVAEEQGDAQAAGEEREDDRDGAAAHGRVAVEETRYLGDLRPGIRQRGCHSLPGGAASLARVPRSTATRRRRSSISRAMLSGPSMNMASDDSSAATPSTIPCSGRMPR